MLQFPATEKDGNCCHTVHTAWLASHRRTAHTHDACSSEQLNSSMVITSKPKRAGKLASQHISDVIGMLGIKKPSKKIERVEMG